MLNSYFKYSISWTLMSARREAAIVQVFNFCIEIFSCASLNENSYAHCETCCQWMLITWPVVTCWVSEW